MMADQATTTHSKFSFRRLISSVQKRKKVSNVFEVLVQKLCICDARHNVVVSMLGCAVSIWVRPLSMAQPRHLEARTGSSSPDGPASATITSII